MVTKLGPLCKVTLLKTKGDRSVVRSPEKAGVGGSTPSLATMFSVTCRAPQPQLRSITFQFREAKKPKNLAPDGARLEVAHAARGFFRSLQSLFRRFDALTSDLREARALTPSRNASP